MFLLESPLLKKRFSATAVPDQPDQETYTALPTDVEGELQPVNLGAIGCGGGALGGNAMAIFTGICPTVLIDPGTQQIAPNDDTWRGRKYKICAKVRNPETGTIHGVSDSTIYRYQDQIVTQLTPATHYNLSDNNTQIDFVTGSANGDLKADAEIRAVSSIGFRDDASGTFTGTASAGILTVPDVIHFLIVCFANRPTSMLDLATFTRSGVTKQGVAGTFTMPSWATSSFPSSAPISAYFDRQVSVSEIVDILAFSVGHHIVFRAGRFVLKKIETTTSASNISLVDADIHRWSESYSIDSIINRINVRWHQFAAGAQNLEFINPPTGKRKKKKRRKKKLEEQIISIETQAFSVAKPSLTKVIGGVSVRNDLGECFGIENESTTTTYFQTVSGPQEIADQLYRQWGRGVWRCSFVDVDGVLMNSEVGDLIIVNRKRSAKGDISAGKVYRILELNKNFANRTVTVLRADEVIA